MIFGRSDVSVMVPVRPVWNVIVSWPASLLACSIASRSVVPEPSSVRLVTTIGAAAPAGVDANSVAAVLAPPSASTAPDPMAATLRVRRAAARRSARFRGSIWSLIVGGLLKGTASL